MSHNGNTMIEEMYYDQALDEVDNTLSEEEQEKWITEWVKEQLENHPDDYVSSYSQSKHPLHNITNKFVEEVFEIAFGENAINRDFSFEEVIETLKKFSNNALHFEEAELERKVYDR